MTPDEINAMIATKVMGWKLMTYEQVNPGSTLGDIKTGCWHDANGVEMESVEDDYEGVRGFYPSIAMESAWKVVERMRDKGFGVSVSADPGEYYCSITKYSGGLDEGELLELVSDASHKTAPMAICRAALAALGEEV